MARLPGLRARLTLAFVVLIALTALGLGLVLPEVARSRNMDSVSEHLLYEAQLAADYYLTTRLDASEVDSWVKRLRRADGAAQTRLTVIAADGRVLGDSDEDPARMDNHADRPEFGQALATGYGSSIRYSATLGYNIIYMAIPIVSDAGVVGVTRAALPLSEIDAMVSDLRRSALIVAGAIAAAATLLALYLAGALTRPLRELTDMARLIAAGRFDRRVRVGGSSEVAQLAETLNFMSQQLRNSFSAIESQRDSLGAIMANMADGIVMVDADGRVAMMNAAAAVMLRTDPDWAEGQTYSALLRYHELIELVRSSRSAVARAREQIAVVERSAPRRYLRGVATPVGEGSQMETLLLLQDLTEMRRLETVRQDFVANVSHELRTPLAAIKAMVETLEDGAIDDPEAARDFISRMHGEVDSLAHLVSELLELSRIESGRASLELAAVAPAAFVLPVVERLSPLAERAGLTLEAEVNADLPPVLADRERIGQALTNLIQNAIKFTPPPGRVTVTARLDGGEIAIAVADSGVGIDSDDLPRLFERFYKADRARSGGGTGLGLAIVKHLVEAHGGRVWADSPGPGKGSTFTFTLPLTEVASGRPPR